MPGRKIIDLAGLGTIPELLPDFQVALKAAGRSQRTAQSYAESLLQFDAFLRDTGRAGRLRDVTAGDVDAFSAHLRELPGRKSAKRSPATVAVRFRSLRAFFNWAVQTGELAASPMVGAARPSVDEVPVNFVSEEEIRKLLGAIEVAERSFEDWRDSAMLRLFYDTGCRLSEIVGLKLKLTDDEDKRPDSDSGLLDVERSLILVLGKGRRNAGPSWRQVTYGVKTRTALHKYLLARSAFIDSRPQEERALYGDWVWIGSRRKPLTQSGVAQMLRRRCAEAGIRRLHPHMYRHARAHDALSRGMSEGDAMTFFGWRSRDMLARYGAALAEERALEAARRLGAPGDRL